MRIGSWDEMLKRGAGYGKNGTTLEEELLLALESSKVFPSIPGDALVRDILVWHGDVTISACDTRCLHRA